MQTQIIRWGNSQGIRIPKSVLADIGAVVGDTLQMTVQNQKIVISKPFAHRTLEERAAEYGGSLGEYSEFDWGDPAGREVW